MQLAGWHEWQHTEIFRDIRGLWLQERQAHGG